MRANYFTSEGYDPAPNLRCAECGCEDLEIFALTALTFRTQNTVEGLDLIEVVEIDDASQGGLFWQEGGLTVRCTECSEEWKDEDLRLHYEIE